MRRDHLLQLAIAGAIEQFGLRQFARFVQGLGELGHKDHPGREFERQARQIHRAGILQGLRNFHYFQRIADGEAKRLIHIGDQRLHLAIETAANAHHHLRQTPGFHLPLHEGARAHLYVEHDRVQAHSDLLRHDRTGNQRNAFHRRRRIAQRVQLAVRGRDLRRLANKRQTGFPQLRFEFLNRQTGAETGNRFQLVQRATGMPQRAARDHWHNHAGRRSQRSRNQTRLVAYATRGVLVHLRARDVRKIDGDAAGDHRVG